MNSFKTSISDDLKITMRFWFWPCSGDVCKKDAKTSIHTYIEHTYLYWVYILILSIHTYIEYTYLYWAYILILSIHTYIEYAYLYWVYILILSIHTYIEYTYLYWVYILILSIHTYIDSFLVCNCCWFILFSDILTLKHF
jgi:hypothetical protein